jgi:hypothetical protein
MRIAATGAYLSRWTDAIQSEWIRNVLADNPTVPASQLERTRRLTEQFSPSSLVTGFESRIADLVLPDLNDRHVLAAAIHAEAPFLVTFNLSDFPEPVLKSFNVEAIHPDPFLSVIFDNDSDGFLMGVRRHRHALKNPPKSPLEYVETLRANHMDELALRISANMDLI